ncbi:MAG: SRPBCC family protein [Acidobacteriia bacterium]|nr:SRPBCC family protein [Terriglobia bacterium]
MSSYTGTDVFAARPEQPNDFENRMPKPLQANNSGLTRFLGWFSIGLGAAEIIAPGAIALISGTRNNRGLIRFYGMREIGAGIGILTQRNPGPWLWSRVAGDLVDIASLIGGARKNSGGATAFALASVAGVTALDVMCAQNCTAEVNSTGNDPERAESSVLISRSPEECYRFWREVENFPRFVNEVRSVRVTGDRTSHWIAGLPGGAGQIEWDAEIDDDVPNQRISWRCLPGSDLFVRGAVNFEAAPGGRGTLVRVQLDFDHTARPLIAPLAKMAGKHPEQIAYKSLRRLKQLLEVGEVITTEGQPAGRRASTTWLDAIAR